MQNKKSFIFSNAVTSLFQVFISTIGLFVVYKYLFIQIGSKQVGLWSVILASTSLARLSDMGLTGSIVKYVARYISIGEHKNASEAIQTALLSSLVFIFILVLALYPIVSKALAFFIPHETLFVALSILPWAFLSVFLGCAGAVVLSALDGCQRIDLRNFILVLGNIIFVIVALSLVKHFGIKSLAFAQVMQGIFTLMLGWLLLRQQINSLPMVPLSFSREKFKEMFAYSLNFQINSILVMLFDPITKLLITKFGGLSSSAFYEVASQLIMKVRSLIVVTSQVTVPMFARLQELSPESMMENYLKVYSMLFFFSIPFYGLVFICLPIISLVLIGHYEHLFYIFSIFLLIGWISNTLTSAAYFYSLGTGNLRLTTLAHLLMTALNFILGCVLGYFFSGVGVVVGSAISLVISSSVFMFLFNKQNQLGNKMLIPSSQLRILAWFFLTIPISLAINLFEISSKSTLILNLINIVIYIFVMFFTMRASPIKKLIVEQLVNSKNN